MSDVKTKCFMPGDREHISEASTPGSEISTPAHTPGSEVSTPAHTPGSEAPGVKGSESMIARLNLNLDVVPGYMTPNTEEGFKLGTSLKKKKKKRPEKPDMTLFVGTLVHSTVDNPMLILPDKIVGIRNGRIEFIEDATELEDCVARYEMRRWRKECIKYIPEMGFLMPGFIDIHCSAFPYITLGMDETRQKRTQNKLKLIHNDTIAHKVFRKHIVRSIVNGVTCAAYNGSPVESAAIMLAKILAISGQRALIGFDFYPGSPQESDQMLHVTKGEDTLKRIARIQSDLVEPFIISSQLLVDWLQARVASIRSNLGLRYLTPIGGTDDIRAQLENLNKCDLLNNKTILECFGEPSREDFELISSKEVSMVYSSQTRIRMKCPDMRMTNYDRTGLCSGLSARSAPSMLQAIRNCVSATQVDIQMYALEKHISELLEELNQLKHYDLCQSGEKSIESNGKELCNGVRKTREETNGSENERLTIQEAFKMATLGGAAALGLDSVIGNFEVGKEFDAIMVNPLVEEGPFDVFSPIDDTQDIIEKFLNLGDDRNIMEVYVKGKRIK